MDTHLQSTVGEGNAAEAAASVRVEEESRPNDFMGQLNQELRTPVSAIMGCAEHLETQCDDASMTDDIKQILKSAHDLLDIIDREVTQWGYGHNAPNAAANSQCDVLHIEDDARSLASVKLLLGSQRKLKVLQAINGEDGIALANTHAPRLVLLDLDLPDIPGSEVIKHLQKEPATARIPVVVLSGDTTPSQIERLLVLGARNYVTKPFQVPAFLAVVDEILQETAST
jgi:CheY-like chemotaxis protein